MDKSEAQELVYNALLANEDDFGEEYVIYVGGEMGEPIPDYIEIVDTTGDGPSFKVEVSILRLESGGEA
jgi:hypothetical protein